MALLYTRNHDNTAISTDRIRELAPAAFSTDKALHLTDRYGKLVTADLIPLMQDYGYQPVQAVQSKRKSKSGLDHKQHFISFANFDNDLVVDGVRPEITVFNSSDGSSAIKLMAGTLRLVCSNGITIGEGTQSRVYHNLKSVESFEVLLKDTIEKLPFVMQRIDQMRGIQMDTVQIDKFTRSAFEVRWDSSKFNEALTAPSMLNVRRLEDAGNDAWRVISRVQESLVRGGVMIQKVTQTGEVKIRNTCQVSNPAEYTRINQEVWNSAVEILELV